MTQFVKKISVLSIMLFLFLLAGCSPDCREACTSVSNCFGNKAGDPDLCTSRCAAENYTAKTKDLSCIASATCTELKQGLCAPDCTQICGEAQCLPAASDCVTRCKALSVTDLNCLHKNSCDLWTTHCKKAAAALKAG